MGFVAPPQKGIVHEQPEVESCKFERNLFVFPPQFSPSHLDVRNGERHELLHRSLVGNSRHLGLGSIGSAVGIINDVNDWMIQLQRMQSHGGTEKGDDLQLRSHAFNAEKWFLVGRFTAVDGQVAGIDAQAKRDGVEFSQFDAASGHLLDRRDDPASDEGLKRISGDIPCNESEANQGENAKPQKKFPQDASALRRNRRVRLMGRRFVPSLAGLSVRWLAQRFRSPLPESGVTIWLPERRLASHPKSNSFIFFSANKSLILPKTSVSGVARSPAFFISGNN